MSGRPHRSLADTPWRPPADFPAPPSPGEVHLWRRPLRAHAGEMEQLWTLLATQEQERADRFHYPRDRESYVLGRATLRRLLGRYLGRPPANVELTYAAHGKPALADPNLGLRFNLSHSGGYWLCGVTTGAELGVDLEWADPDIDTRLLSERFFSPTEVADLLALPPEGRTTAFFRTWTRKEAFLKAEGAGLQLPLERFSVTVDPEAAVRLRSVDWSPDLVGDYRMAGFDVAPGLPAALALRGSLTTVRYFDVPH